jgi:hypothetical protein
VVQLMSILGKRGDASREQRSFARLSQPQQLLEVGSRRGSASSEPTSRQTSLRSSVSQPWEDVPKTAPEAPNDTVCGDTAPNNAPNGPPLPPPAGSSTYDAMLAPTLPPPTRTPHVKEGREALQ